MAQLGPRPCHMCVDTGTSLSLGERLGRGPQNDPGAQRWRQPACVQKASVCACCVSSARLPARRCPGPTHRQGCGGRQERRWGQPHGEGAECVLVLVCVLVCVLVLVELCPLQRPWAQGGAGPLGALHQKTRVQLLPEQLVIYKRKRERDREARWPRAPGGARRIVTWHSRFRQAKLWWPPATCGPQGGGNRGACDQVPIRILA